MHVGFFRRDERHGPATEFLFEAMHCVRVNSLYRNGSLMSRQPFHVQRKGHAYSVFNIDGRPALLCQGSDERTLNGIAVSYERHGER